MKKKSILVILIIFSVLFLDQSLKIWVKTNMLYGQEIFLGGYSWARFHFVENNGMAFGLSLGEYYGKLALSLFRIIAVVFLIYYIRKLIEANASKGFIASFSLILAGAIGNIIDSAFYGLIFTESYHGEGLATMFPEEGGYASFLFGRVVDMLYFPIYSGVWPSWIPYLGGNTFEFFRPVFNIADMAITTGVVAIILFHRSFFNSAELYEEETSENSEEQSSLIIEEENISNFSTEESKETSDSTSLEKDKGRED